MSTAPQGGDHWRRCACARTEYIERDQGQPRQGRGLRAERKGRLVKVASSASGITRWVKGDYVGKTERSASVPYTIKGDYVNPRQPGGGRGHHRAPFQVRPPTPAQREVEHRSGALWWMYLSTCPGGSGSGRPGKSVRRAAFVPNSPVGQRLIARAQEMKGTPYVWGGESDDGVDCSGLIYKLLLDEGASGKCLPRRASEQMAQLGLEIDKESLQPGDLVFFSTYKPGPSHVGIYLGDGDFIHASSAQHQVAISEACRTTTRRVSSARRITEDELHLDTKSGSRDSASICWIAACKLCAV